MVSAICCSEQETSNGRHVAETLPRSVPSVMDVVFCPPRPCTPDPPCFPVLTSTLTASRARSRAIVSREGCKGCLPPSRSGGEGGDTRLVLFHIAHFLPTATGSEVWPKSAFFPCSALLRFRCEISASWRMTLA